MEIGEYGKKYGYYMVFLTVVHYYVVILVERHKTLAYM
jgi:hypothetical protein